MAVATPTPPPRLEAGSIERETTLTHGDFKLNNLMFPATSPERALSRRAFGRHLSDDANVQDWIAHSRVEIDQARLFVLQAAWKMDTSGNRSAHLDVSAIQRVAAQLQTRVVDRAMQVFGAMGVTPDTPLSYLWSWGRAMRFFDGPDEVHLRSIARAGLARARDNLGSTAPYYYFAG